MVNLLSTRKLTIYIIIPVLVIVIISGAIFYLIAQQQLIAPHKRNALSTAERALDKLESSLIASDTDSIIATLLEINETHNINNIYIVLKDGRTIRSEPKTGTYNPTLKDPFTEHALKLSSNYMKINGDILQVAIPIFLDEKIGVVRIDYSLVDVNSDLKSLLRILISISVFMIVLITVVAYLRTEIITKPVKQLQEISNEISSGNYDVSLKEISNDETGDLVKSFVNIVKDSAEFREKLDETIKQRTVITHEAVERATSNLKLQISDEEQLSKSLNVILRQLRETNIQLEESQRELKNKKDELEQSNSQLRAAELKLEKFNEQLEEKVKERTAELVEANFRIQKLLEMKSQFVSQVSHDLRTPLTPILTLLPLIKKEVEAISNKELRKDLIEMISLVVNNAEYLSNIVTNTLSISRLDAGKTQLNLQPENMFDVISEVITTNEVVFKEKGITAINNVDKNMPKVYVDRMRIRELLNNLIMNASKFMPDKKEIAFEGGFDDKYITIGVKDTGIGIDKKHLIKIFEEFFKADPSRHEHSTGLGLSICQRIVEKHHGKIWAESEGLGKGSTFYFTLPIYKK